MSNKQNSLFNAGTAQAVRLERLCGNFMMDQDPSDALAELKNKISLCGSTVLVTCAGEHMPELNKSQKFVAVVKSVLDQFTNKKFCMVLDKSWHSRKQFESCTVEDILYLDYFLALTYFNNKDLPAVTWNPQSDKFLFLTGRMHKINRTTLLYMMWSKGLLEKCEWSWSLNDDHGKQMFPELTEQQYQQFIASVTRSLDAWGVYGNQNYNNEMYCNKLFELVSETKFEQDYMVPAFVTEKTWKSMANGLPFIIAGPLGILESLENLGFDTFRDLLLIKNYDNPATADYLSGLENWMCMTAEQWSALYNNIRDVRWPGNVSLPDTMSMTAMRRDYPDIFKEILNHEQPLPDLPDKMKRLSAVLANVNHWLEHLPAHASEVSVRVLHNQRLFNELGKKVLDQLDHWAQKHNLSNSIKLGKQA
jgi:hypothetical protein